MIVFLECVGAGSLRRANMMKMKISKTRYAAAIFMLLFGVFIFTATFLEYFHIYQVPPEGRFAVIIVSVFIILVSGWILRRDARKAIEEQDERT